LAQFDFFKVEERVLISGFTTEKQKVETIEIEPKKYLEKDPDWTTEPINLFKANLSMLLEEFISGVLKKIIPPSPV
jgi:hypothetical protein